MTAVSPKLQRVLRTPPVLQHLSTSAGSPRSLYLTVPSSRRQRLALAMSRCPTRRETLTAVAMVSLSMQCDAVPCRDAVWGLDQDTKTL